MVWPTQSTVDFFLPNLTGGVCPDPPPPLPEGWVVVRHDSGGLVYLHRPSRVCSWARPYSVSTSATVKVHCTGIPVHQGTIETQLFGSAVTKIFELQMWQPRIEFRYYSVIRVTVFEAPYLRAYVNDSTHIHCVNTLVCVASTQQE